MGLDLAAILSQSFLIYKFYACVTLCVYCIYVQGFYRYTGHGTSAPLGLGWGFFLALNFLLCNAISTFMRSMWADDSVENHLSLGLGWGFFLALNFLLCNAISTFMRSMWADDSVENHLSLGLGWGFFLALNFLLCNPIPTFRRSMRADDSV